MPEVRIQTEKHKTLSDFKSILLCLWPLAIEDAARKTQSVTASVLQLQADLFSLCRSVVPLNCLYLFAWLDCLTLSLCACQFETPAPVHWHFYSSPLLKLCPRWHQIIWCDIKGKTGPFQGEKCVCWLKKYMKTYKYWALGKGFFWLSETVLQTDIRDWLVSWCTLIRLWICVKYEGCWWLCVHSCYRAC